MIELKSRLQIDKIRQASGILVEVIKRVREQAKAGIKTDRLDEIAYKLIIARKARPAFLGYRGFPKSICASVNEEIVHGIPGERILKEGDILSIDVGVQKDGFYSDAAVTLGIGKVSKTAKKLMDVTRESLLRAIEAALVGNRISDISHAVQGHAETNDFSVIREFVGHGVGLDLHEEPQIPNFGKPGIGIKLKQGMVFAIEPMISAGGYEIEILDDGWTAVTKDRSLSAHYEHTIAITEDGPEVLTDGIL